MPKAVTLMSKRQKPKVAKKGLNRRLLYGVALTTIILLVVVVTYYLFLQPQPESWTAAVVDQVTVEGLLNPTFNTTTSSLLNNSGFDVKYYPGSDVTVGFYRDLPSKGSKIVILRAHSAVRDDNASVDLFTSERFEVGKYADYGKQISRAEFLTPPYNEYFAIGPTFVNSSMRGKFDADCVVILMGCNSLNKTSMAKALVEGRGAKVVIGWTRLVELNDADTSIVKLLQYLLDDRNSVATAVGKLNPPSHPYHPYGTTLDYYPKSAGNYIVPQKSEAPLNLGWALQFLLLAPLPKCRKKVYDF